MTTHQLCCASIYLKIILSKLYCKSLLSRNFAFLVLCFSPFTKNNHLWLIVLTNSHSPFSGCDLIMPHVFPTLLFTFVILPHLCHIIACFREDFLYCLMFLQIIICLLWFCSRIVYLTCGFGHCCSYPRFCLILLSYITA